MIAKTKFTLRGKQAQRYLALVQAFPLTSIQSDEHLHAAAKVIDRLLAAESRDSGEDLYLDALSDLVASYEDRHCELPLASDADMLRHLMEARAVTAAQLSREANVARSTISEVLSGKRPLSRQMIRKLADYFQVDVGILAANL